LLFFLQLHEFELAEGLEDVPEVVLGDGEVDVADVETVEWYSIGLGGGAFGVAGLAVLLCFSELGNDRNADELLSGELNGFLH